MNPKVYEALHWASSYLKTHDRDANAGELVLQYVMQSSRSQLLAQLHEALSGEQAAAFRQLIERHASGVPVQHLIGCESFYGRSFFVNKDVLIPRPETEELVYHALEKMSGKKQPSVADIGTGSGAIAVTVKAERPDADVHAVDLSEKALQTARKNAEAQNTSIAFYHGDLLAPLIEKSIQVDVLLSNPPYIPAGEQASLSTVVVDHEPHMALFGGEDGLDLYRQLARQLPLVLKKGGIAGVETGAGQTAAVEAMFQAVFPAGKTERLYDINGKDRMVFLYTEAEKTNE